MKGCWFVYKRIFEREEGRKKEEEKKGKECSGYFNRE